MKKLLIILLCLLLVGCSASSEVVEQEPIGYSDPIYVVATKDSNITTIEDLNGKNIGIQTNYDEEECAYVVEQLIDAKIEFTTIEIGSYQEIPDYLSEGKIDAWIITSAIHDDGLLTDYRHDYVIEDYIIVDSYQIPIYEEEAIDDKITSCSLWNEPFAVMLTGLDERVDPDANNKARNDVNILMVVDPARKHILTVSFPRDSFVYMPTLGYSAKLTEVGVRAGNEDEIRNAIGYEMGIEIPYFVQVSFSTFVDMINSLGGIYIDVPYDVYMDMDSYRNVAQPYDMSKGYKNVLGEWALALARNRKYAGIYNSDYGRIRNQCLIVNSIFERIADHPFILNWAGWHWMAPLLAYYNFDDTEFDTLFALASEFADGYTIDNYFIENTGGISESGAWIGYMIDSSVEIAKGKINLALTGEIDENNPYYEQIMIGNVTGGADTKGYIENEYDLSEVYDITRS